MRIFIGLFLACFLWLFTSEICLAQGKEIYFESWSTDHLRGAELLLDLDSSADSHAYFVGRWHGTGYKLILTKIPAGNRDLELEYWYVELKEVLSKPSAKSEKLGCNLLLAEGCGPGKHHFPREDWAHYLFPREEEQSLVDKVVRGGGAHYPIMTKRVIKVRSFYVIIQVKSYRMNKENPKKIDFMNVSIDITNRYCPQLQKTP